jgi:hypothetical protein
MWFHRYGFGRRGPRRFHFYAGMPGFWLGHFPPVEEELRWLEEYRKDLKDELEEVDRRIERLSGEKKE